jgi:hypothetical protein
MKTIIHSHITTQALIDELHPDALRVVIQANMRQDSWWAQLGWHDHYHMDNNAFPAGNAYIERQHQLAIQNIEMAGATHDLQARKVYQNRALQALGKLTHTAQDLYAHSNYCALWLDAAATPEEPEEINPFDPEILYNPILRSGKGSLLELLSFLIPVLQPLAERNLGPDTHMHMNLDHPGRGALYPYALAAAVKRTRIEYSKLITQLKPEDHWLLTGKIG